MPSIPIPMIGALVLGFLFAALVLRRDRHWLVSVLVGACALQALIISLGQHYGVDSFRAVQPVTAASIPPLALLVSALFDAAVALAHMAGAPHWQPWMVSAGFACMLAMLGALALSQSLTIRSREESAAEAGKAPGHDVNPGADAEIVTRLNALLTDQELYLDPDPTLGRLSRRLGVPVKQLSAAINRVTHGNVSRYVNRFRIERA